MKMFNDHATEQEFLDYLKKIDWQIGDILKNVEEEKKLKRLNKRIKNLESFDIKSVTDKFDDLIYLVQGMPGMISCKNHLERSKSHFTREFSWKNSQKQRTEERAKSFSGIIISSFVYHPSKTENVKSGYYGSYTRDIPAKLEIQCVNLDDKKIMTSLWLSRWEKPVLAHWRRINKRKPIRKKKETIPESASNEVPVTE